MPQLQAPMTWPPKYNAILLIHSEKSHLGSIVIGSAYLSTSCMTVGDAAGSLAGTAHHLI